MRSVAYIDESGGTDANGRTFVLGGFVANADTWTRFSSEWRATLEAPPTCPSVHMTDISGPGKRGWERLSRSERQAKLLELVDLTVSHDLQGIVAMVDLARFRSAAAQLTTSQRETLGLHKPYVPAAIGLLRSLASIESQWGYPIGRVDFMFEEQDEFEPTVDRHRRGILNRLLADQAPDVLERTGEVVWGSKSDHVPLQAADMLAWNVRRARDKPDEDNAVHTALRYRGRLLFYQPSAADHFFVTE